MFDYIPITVFLNPELVNEFQLFFKSKGIDFNSGIVYVICDFLSKVQTKILNEKMNEYKLSPRKKEVVQFLVQGLQSKEIGAKMNLSTYTCKNHVRSVFKKCQVNNKIELFIKLTGLTI